MAQLRKSTVNGHFISMIDHGYGSESGLFEVASQDPAGNWAQAGWLTLEEAHAQFEEFVKKAKEWVSV